MFTPKFKTKGWNSVLGKKTILDSLLKCAEIFVGPNNTNPAFASSQGYLGTTYYKSLVL